MTRPVTVIDRDPNRIDEALAWYQNGTLSDDDRHWVEQRLAADPALRAALGARAAAVARERHSAESFQREAAALYAWVGQALAGKTV